MDIRQSPEQVSKQRALLHADLASPWNSNLADVPPEVLSVPSMMTVAERKFLYNVAKNHYSGTGIIVDAGIFLGASTNCFGRGLIDANFKSRSKARASARPIVSIDLGIANRTMFKFFERHQIDQTNVVEGQSFEHLIRQNIEAVANLVDLRIGDVTQHGAVSGPIEILFLDLLKQEHISFYAIREYFPKLIPNVSIVIQQDYFIEALPFMKVHQEYFASKFVFLGEVGPSAVFRCVEPITESDVKRFEEEVADPENQIRLASLSVYRSKDPARQLMMACSKLKLMMQLKGADAARKYFGQIESEFDSTIGDPKIPPRLSAVVRAARFLCDSKGSSDDIAKAARMGLGH